MDFCVTITFSPSAAKTLTTTTRLFGVIPIGCDLTSPQEKSSYTNGGCCTKTQGMESNQNGDTFGPCLIFPSYHRILN